MADKRKNKLPQEFSEAKRIAIAEAENEIGGVVNGFVVLGHLHGADITAKDQ
jgi:hypothetical protein